LNYTEEEILIRDRGGSRSGVDRRKNIKPYNGEERRSGWDRRRGFDRRSGLARRRTHDRRRGQWDGSGIERRDVFRR
jgi:hypothetical protein